jgi:hypothetical protein
VEVDFTQAFNNIIAQGPLVTFAVIALWYTRKDLAEAKADNKTLTAQVVKMHEATLSVIEKNTEANTKLSERINDLQAT